MKRNDIDKIFTAMLSEKLSEGYNVLTDSFYNGKIVLEKDGRYFGLIIRRFHEWSEEFYSFEGVEILFGENRTFKPDWIFDDEGMKTEFARRFYKIAVDFYGTKDEASSARRIHKKRIKAQASLDLDEKKELVGGQLMSLVMNKVRKERGWKKCGFKIESAYHYRDIRDGKVIRSFFRITVKGENKSATFTYNHFGC